MNAARTYNVLTFGCQMNERDSETIAGMLEDMGYTSEADKKKADVAVINTCSVRENADKRFFGTLGQLKRVKEKRPGFIVCICGCMMQQPRIVETVKSKYPWVDIIFGTHNIHEFPDLLKKAEMEGGMKIDVWDQAEGIAEGLPSKRLYHHKSFVNIMAGCNNFCTYCIVPYTRGRERSRRPGDIEDEVRRLADDGVREVTLLGQNVNSYKGRGGGEDMDFTALVHRLSAIEGLERIRFMTSHPKDLSGGLIDAFSSCEKLCPHIHLPVQSGSDRVLARMNRRYTSSQYLGLIEKLRSARSDIAITTDIIVGFPGETDEDFRDTMRVVEEAKFDSAFTFLYSVRPGTPAADYPDQIEEDVKHERFDELVEKVNSISLLKNSALLGKIEDVLVDGESKTRKNMLTGRTGGFKLVNFSGSSDLTGSIRKVEITGSNTFSLTGRML